MENPFHLLSRRELFRDDYIRVIQDRVRRPNGTQSNFTFLHMKSGVAVLPLTELGEVYLVREWKYAQERPSLEVMGGGIEEGESLLDSAKRELREEGGLEAEEWVALGHIDPITSMVNASIHLYLASGLRHVAAEPEEGEILEIVKMTLAEAVAKVVAGEITQSGSVAVILRAALLRSD